MRFVLGAVPILALYVFLFRRFDFVCDDAYISFEYAKNLVAGHGLRFHPTAEPIQGYTNFLWVLWNALLLKVGIDPGLGSRLTSFACGLHLLLGAMRLAAARAGGRPSAGVAAGFLLAGLAPFAAWSSSGLETVPVAWALFWTFERLAGGEKPRAPGAAAFAIIAVLLRADAIVHLGLVALGAFVATEAGRRGAYARAAAPVAGAVLAVVVAYLAWSASYFGDWVPQTAHAKVGGSAEALEQGWKYVATMVVTFPSLLLAIFIPWGAPRGAAPFAAATAGIAAGTFLYAALVGGDWMAFGRFLVPGLSFLAVSFGVRAAAPGTTAGSRGMRRGMVIVVILLSLPGAFDRPRLPDSILRPLHFRWNTKNITSELEYWRRIEQNARENGLLGKALALHTKPGDSIVLGAIGVVAWATDLYIYDRNGLVSREVTDGMRTKERRSPGHLKLVAPAYFVALKPTILQAAISDSARGVDAIPAPGRAVATYYERVALPLPAEDGFAPGTSLVLLRLRPAAAGAETPDASARTGAAP